MPRIDTFRGQASDISGIVGDLALRGYGAKAEGCIASKIYRMKKRPGSQIYNRYDMAYRGTEFIKDGSFEDDAAEPTPSSNWTVSYEDGATGACVLQDAIYHQNDKDSVRKHAISIQHNAAATGYTKVTQAIGSATTKIWGHRAYWLRAHVKPSALNPTGATITFKTTGLSNSPSRTYNMAELARYAQADGWTEIALLKVADSTSPTGGTGYLTIEVKSNDAVSAATFTVDDVSFAEEVAVTGIFQAQVNATLGWFEDVEDVPATEQKPQILLANPGFETDDAWESGPAGSDTGEANYSTGTYRSGARSCKITHLTGATGYLIRQYQYLKAGKTYTYAESVRVEAANTPNEVKFAITSEAGSELDTDTADMTVTGAWQPLQVTYSPATDMGAYIKTNVKLSAGQGDAWVDDVGVSVGTTMHVYEGRDLALDEASLDTTDYGNTRALLEYSGGKISILRKAVDTSTDHWLYYKDDLSNPDEAYYRVEGIDDGIEIYDLCAVQGYWALCEGNTLYHANNIRGPYTKIAFNDTGQSYRTIGTWRFYGATCLAAFNGTLWVGGYATNDAGVTNWRTLASVTLGTNADSITWDIERVFNDAWCTEYTSGPGIQAIGPDNPGGNIWFAAGLRSGGNVLNLYYKRMTDQTWVNVNSGNEPSDVTDAWKVWGDGGGVYVLFQNATGGAAVQYYDVALDDWPHENYDFPGVWDDQGRLTNQHGRIIVFNGYSYWYDPDKTPRLIYLSDIPPVDPPVYNRDGTPYDPEEPNRGPFWKPGPDPPEDGPDPPGPIFLSPVGPLVIQPKEPEVVPATSLATTSRWGLATFVTTSDGKLRACTDHSLPRYEDLTNPYEGFVIDNGLSGRVWPNACSYAGWLNIFDAARGVIRTDGKRVIHSGVEIPGSTPTVAAGAAGSITGTYVVAFSLYNSATETESEISTQSAEVVVASQKIDVSNMKANTTFDKKRVYRTLNLDADGSGTLTTMFLEQEIAGTATTVTLIMTDAELAEQRRLDTTVRKGLPPMQFGATFGDQMCMAGAFPIHGWCRVEHGSSDILIKSPAISASFRTATIIIDGVQYEIGDIVTKKGARYVTLPSGQTYDGPSGDKAYLITYNPNYAYVTDIDLYTGYAMPELVNMNAPIRIASDDGDRIIGLAVYRDYPYAFKMRSTHAIARRSTNISTSFDVAATPTALGFLHRTIAKDFRGNLLGFTPHIPGIYSFAGQDMVHLTRLVDDVFRGLDHTYDLDAHAVYHPTEQKYFLFVTTTTRLDTILVYDDAVIDETTGVGRFTKYQVLADSYSGTPPAMTCSAIIYDSSGEPHLLVGDSAGNVWELMVGNRDYGLGQTKHPPDYDVTMTMTWKSLPFSVSETEDDAWRQTQLPELVIIGEANTGTVTARTYVNFSNTYSTSDTIDIATKRLDVISLPSVGQFIELELETTTAGQEVEIWGIGFRQNAEPA